MPHTANATDIYYRGAVVYIDTGGGVQVTWGAGDRPIGIYAGQQATVTAGDEVEVVIFGLMVFPSITGIAAADEGNTLIMDTDAPPTDNIDDADSTEGIVEAAGDLRVGRIMRVTADSVYVLIGGITGSLSVGLTGTWD
jgi:hypothetical protein